MSNKNGGDFNNLAARRFKVPDKIDGMSQKDVFSILETDIKTILDQITRFRVDHGKFPKYVPNMFANISTALWFHEYVMDNVTVKAVNRKGKKVKLKKAFKSNSKKVKFKVKSDLSDEDLESLRFILADAYKKSLTNFYAAQTQEFESRMKYLSNAFAYLSPKQYAIARLLGRSKTKTKELIIQVYGDPVQNMRYVAKLVDEAKGDISDKKKLKILRALYGKSRFITAVGAAMTVTKNDSDCIASCFEFMMKKKETKRALYLKAYAEAYKINKSSNFRMQDPSVWKKNKRLYKMLGEYDEGFKKSYKGLKPKKSDDNMLAGTRPPMPHKMPKEGRPKRKD